MTIDNISWHNVDCLICLRCWKLFKTLQIPHVFLNRIPLSHSSNYCVIIITTVRHFWQIYECSFERYTFVLLSNTSYTYENIQ